MHLFTTVGPLATYIGEVVTGDPPYVWRRSLDVKQDAERNVIVFCLVPVGRVQVEVATPAEVEKPAAWTPPSDTEYAQASQLVDGRVVSRKEMRLQAVFGLWLQSIGHTVQRYPILLPNSSTYVHPDLFDATSQVVVEAKKSAARSYVREAIGQVLDYHNLLNLSGNREVKPAILLPDQPERDLVVLCRNLQILVYTRDELGFVEITSIAHEN